MKKLFTFFAALGLALTTQAANIAVSGLLYCDAYYWTYEDEESGSSIALYDFDLYVDYDSDTEILTYPEVYVQVPANSKTALNGTYEVWYAGYWKSAKDSVESDEYATDAVGTITFKNVDSEGNYQVSLSFTATDGNTYTVDDTVNVWALDYDNDTEITLTEGGSAPAGDMLTCAEAAQIAAANGYKGTTEVTVYGYVTELINDKVDNNGNQKQSFWMADTENGGQQFEAYYAFVPSKFAVGDRVSVTGILQNYNGTIEIADGQAALLGEGGSTSPDEPNTGDMLTCAEAAQIAAAEGYKGTSDVTVYGYVTELINDKVDNNGNQKQSFWMADTENGGKQFEAYYAFVPSKFAVGDRVSVTGILQNYNGTIEIADGQAALLGEGGSTDPDEPNTGDMLTCAEAAQIAAAEGYKGTSDVTVYGYVTELINDKVDNNGNQKQSFWMADTENGGKQFEAYYAFVPSKFAVGDRVSVTGILQNYNGTIEIADGQAALLGEGEGGGSDPDEPGTDGALYQIDFKTDITGWTIDDKDLGKLTYVWKQDKSYGMKGSAYNQQAYAAESWLISPAIDLTNAVAPSLVISQALNKGTAENLAVKVSADNGNTWTDLTINMPAGNSWDFQEDQTSLAAFAGKTIQIAFAYKSTTSVCPTWEIGSVLVQDGGAALQQTEQESKATKMLRNGQLYIQRGEKTYTVTGAQIRK